MSELSDPADKFSETLNISISQEKSIISGSLKPFPPSSDMSESSPLCSEPTPKDNTCSISGYFGPLEPASPLLPHLSHDLISPICETEFKEQAASFSLRQDNWTCQTFGAMSSVLEGLMEPSFTEAPSSCSSDFSQVTSLFRSLSHQSDSLESDGATAPMSDLYIFESETQDFILNLSVHQKQNKHTEYQPVSQPGGWEADLDSPWQQDSENAVTQIHYSSSHERAMLDCESEVSHHKGLTAPAADACKGSTMSVNDAQQGKAEVTDITPQVQQSNSPIEMWLDACQHLAIEDTDNKEVLDKTGQSVMQEVLTVTGDCLSCGNSQVSGYNPDGNEGIGWTDDDTLGWGQPVERWSSVDSWASALSDWTGITTALPEDLTAAFTEIGAEIDALRQALAEVDTHIDTETSGDRKGQEPAVQAQSQRPMGVQDQSLKTKNLPDGSILSEQSCLSLCLEASGHELQDREVSLCDTTHFTPGEKEPDEIMPCPKHLHTQVVSSDPTVASPGRYGIDVIPESTYSTDEDLSNFGGYLKSLETGISIKTDEDRVVLNITEVTDLEEQKAPAELLIEEVRRLLTSI